MELSIACESGNPRVQIEMVEESSVHISREDLAEWEALEIAESYERYFSMVFPSPRDPEHYILRAKGYAGLFPLRRGKYIRVMPKVPCAAVWGMLAYTKNASSLQWFQGQVRCDSIEQIFEFLAMELLRRIEARLQRGLRWDYESVAGRGSPIRGRILGPDRRSEWGLEFRYAEGGIDCHDNQILLWTLYRLQAMRWPGELRADIDTLYRRLRPEIRLVPTCEQKLARSSVRQQQQIDYREMHILCRFLLDHIGPGVQKGALPAIPFALHMPSLFEECVSMWLIRSFAAKWQIKRQWDLDLDGSDTLSFRIDLAFFDREGKTPLAVVDTKYKLDREPATQDIQQVVAYAVRLGVKKAILIYPHKNINALSLRIGEVAVYSIGLDLSYVLWANSGSHLNKQMEELMSYN